MNDAVTTVLKIPPQHEPTRPRVQIPVDVRHNATIAIAVRETMPSSERGMTDVGLRMAYKLASCEHLSLDDVRKVSGYFPRHEVDKDGATWETWGKGRQSWNGWGGDEGWEWSTSVVADPSAYVER